MTQNKIHLAMKLINTSKLAKKINKEDLIKAFAATTIPHAKNYFDGKEKHNNLQLFK